MMEMYFMVTVILIWRKVYEDENNFNFFTLKVYDCWGSDLVCIAEGHRRETKI